MARTDNLTNFLTDVSTAIKAKKGDETPIPASNFDTEITNLPSGGSKFAPTYVSFSNYGGTTAETLNLENLDTSNMVSMYNMFYSCPNLTSLDLSSFNTSKVTNMSNMFASCNSLTSLNLSGTDLSKITNSNNMFNNCKNLEYVNVGDFGASTIEDFTYMFYGCSKLITIDGTINMTWGRVANRGLEFYNCTSLQNVKVKSLNDSLDLSKSPLSTDSVNYLLENIGNGRSSTLTLGADNLAKADATLLENARSKGWTIV